MLPDHIASSVATSPCIGSRDFDTKTLWQEMEDEEASIKARYRSGTRRVPVHEVKRPFWRQKGSPENKKKRPGQWGLREKQSRWGMKEIASPPRPKKTVVHQRKPHQPNNIKHAINLLSDSTNKLTRINCLNYMDSYLVDPNDSLSSSKVDTMEILKAITKTFVDKKEPIRSLSIDIVHKHIGSVKARWDYQISIKYIIPVIVHCILGDVYMEKSEEIRLKLVRLLKRIVAISSNEEDLKPICGDVIGVLIKLMADSYNTIQREVCALIVELSTKIRLHAVSNVVIENVIPLLGHRQSNVRIAAIKLTECMLMNGGHEKIQKLTGFREHNVVPLEWWFGGELRANYFGGLCRHSNTAVREAFYQMIFKVMSEMRERYDYKTLLLSYVLSGLQDFDQHIQHVAFETIEHIGAMHEKDEYNDLKRTLFFHQQAEQIKRQHLGDDDEFLLPQPFKHRPCLGSRILIREHFNRIVQAALDELTAWKEDCREMAIVLVRNMLIYSEDHCTPKTEILLSAMRKVIMVKNRTVSSAAKECCALIGKSVYPMIWVDYLADAMYHEFDISLVKILRRLVIGCPIMKLVEFIPRIVSLVEYSMHQMSTSDAIRVKDAINRILVKLKDAKGRADHDGERKQQEAQNQEVAMSFEFSSEYLGFHLQIVDETAEESLHGGKAVNKLNVSNRIDKMLRINEKWK